MLPGPVFQFELSTTARRRWFYMVRAFYAAFLLIVLWAIHATWEAAYADHGARLPAAMVKWFAMSAFGGIALGQEVLVLVLAPALIAGTIADEKARKTLHYLLASRLTSPEIVLGKLFARMLYVGVLLGVSVPILSLLVLLGGIDPWLVLLSCGATASTAWFLGSISIWVSTIARRPREAFFIAYGLEGLWLALPPLLNFIATTGHLAIDVPAQYVAEWLGASSPVVVISVLVYPLLSGGPASWAEALGWMIGLQLATGIVLAVLAAVQLRPIFRRPDGAASQPRGLRALLTPLRARSHRPLRDRPMLWKELNTGRARGFAQLVGGLLALIGGGYLAYYAVWFGLMAYFEFLQVGYVPLINWETTPERFQFYRFLTMVVPLVYLVAVVTVAGSAATGFTSEHEEDTWVSLTATDLTGREIVFAKLLGALRQARWLWLVIGLLVLAGVGVGSFDPLTLPVLGLALLVYGGFAAVLGVLDFDPAPLDRPPAQFLTISGLFLVNFVGQVTISLLSFRGLGPELFPGCTPYEVGKLLFSPGILDRLSRTDWPQLWPFWGLGEDLAARRGWATTFILRFWPFWGLNQGLGWLAIFSIVSLVLYTALAVFLAWDTLRRFEIVAGRARRNRKAVPGPSNRGGTVTRARPAARA